MCGRERDAARETRNLTGSMPTALVTHRDCLAHETPAGHPERVERLRAVLSALEAPEFRGLRRDSAPAAKRSQLAGVHSPAYVKAVLAAIPKRGFARLDSDTAVSPGSGKAALRAAGAVIRAVDLVMKGEVRNAFCAVRPPGHHAEASRAMGFCLFNNVAVGVAHARSVYGIKRIAVIDFDVHHGNGTQHSFENDPDTFYASTHQWPLYPRTGALEERGVAGNVLNMPLAPGAGSKEFRAALSKKLLPALKKFRPEFIFISAGFDAHRSDPLAQLRLETEDYVWATQRICQAAQGLCNGRVVSALEGGYDLAALASSAAAHVRALMAA
jgi:acetoin utilization deacetylase AcuC-like enzyme